MILAFLSLALLDILTTYIGRKRGFREGNPILARLGTEIGLAVQAILYGIVFYMFDRMHVVGQFIMIAIPAYAMTRNLKVLLRG